MAADDRWTDLVAGRVALVTGGAGSIGTASCGPGPLPRYHLRAEPAEFSFVFSVID